MGHLCRTAGKTARAAEDRPADARLRAFSDAELADSASYRARPRSSHAGGAGMVAVGRGRGDRSRPGNPPTPPCWPAVVKRGDAQQQAKGTLLCLLLLLLLAALAALGYGLWKAWVRTLADLTGTRPRSQRVLPERALSGFLPACGVLCAAVLLMLAQRDDVGPVGTSLSFGLLSALIAPVVGLLWLEWGPQRGTLWVWLPLALPALPLVTGQYAIALHWASTGTTPPCSGATFCGYCRGCCWCCNPPGDGSIPGLSSPPEPSAGDGQKSFTAEMPAAGAPCATGLCHRLFRQHGAIHADAVAGRGAFRHADHRNRRAQQRGSIPIIASRALGLLLVTGTVFGLAALLSRLAGRYRQGLR